MKIRAQTLKRPPPALCTQIFLKRAIPIAVHSYHTTFSVHSLHVFYHTYTYTTYSFAYAHNYKMKLLRTNSNTSNGSSALADSAESMLHSMQKFVSAVNSMDETILVPNRLKDMAADVHQVPDASGMVSGAGSGEVSPCPSETPPMQEENNHIDDNESVDLYSFYAMLNAVKMELERGGKPHGVEEEVNPVYKHGPGVKSKVKLNEAVTDQRSMAVARRFRSHISGLNRCLIQMTETAEFLSNKYQEDVTNP